MVHDAARSGRTSIRFKTLILPNIAALSDAQCAQLARSSSAAAASSRRTRRRSTTSGARRGDFGLADLFGVSFAGRDRRADAERLPAPRRETRRPGSVIRSSRARGRAAHHPRRAVGCTSSRTDGCFRRRSRSSRPIPTCRWRRSIRASRRPTRRGVPARARPRAASSTSPGTSTARSGKCCASTTASCCATPSRGRRTRSRRSRSTGPGVLDVTVWRQSDSMTVHLVNLTNPMMMKGPIREVIPVGPRRRAHPDAAGRAPVEDSAAHGRTQRRARRRAGRYEMTVTVPSVEVHEVIAIDL